MKSLSEKTKKVSAMVGIIIILALPSLACQGTTVCQYDNQGNVTSCQDLAGDAMGIGWAIENAGK